MTLECTCGGHANVPQRYVTADGLNLGKWLSNQRTRYHQRGQPVGLQGQHLFAAMRQAAVPACGNMDAPRTHSYFPKAQKRLFSPLQSPRSSSLHSASTTSHGRGRGQQANAQRRVESLAVEKIYS